LSFVTVIHKFEKSTILKQFYDVMAAGYIILRLLHSAGIAYAAAAIEVRRPLQQITLPCKMQKLRLHRKLRPALQHLAQ